MADQSLKIDFDHIGRIKEYHRNKNQQADDDRYYAVKTDFEHYGRILCARVTGNMHHASVTGNVSPNRTITEPTLWQKLVTELKFRLKQVGPPENAYYKTNTFKRNFVR